MGNNKSFEHRPNDGIALFERAARIVAALLVVLILALGYAFVGTWDYADALTAEAIAKDARGAAATTATLSHPLPYTATVIQSGDGIDTPRVRYYIPKETK
jgi:hypothetical protein